MIFSEVCRGTSVKPHRHRTVVDPSVYNHVSVRPLLIEDARLARQLISRRIGSIVAGFVESFSCLIRRLLPGTAFGAFLAITVGQSCNMRIASAVLTMS